MCLLQLGDSVINILHSSRSPHILGRKVDMSSRSIPISLLRLGMEIHIDFVLFTQLIHDESGDPQIIRGFQRIASSDLILPLTRKHLIIGSIHMNSSFHRHLSMSLDDLSSKRLISSNPAIVGSLRSDSRFIWRHPIIRFLGMSVIKNKLLFDSAQGSFMLIFFVNRLQLVSEI